ncbi:glutathionylspermidine synthase family protein [Desulfosporosinus sp. Sb-LF]|uniref:glutathionylspermidine synthase family protein n=1 Tax=Desulfosporosinus sp. Sb-LF TaxID=2560027 RepID=UPI001FB1134C|nr:glutathionylspermidine synthase family protein [Desulfosporosinus sp. Sb-LF]
MAQRAHRVGVVPRREGQELRVVLMAGLAEVDRVPAELPYEKLREQLYGPLRSVFSWDWMNGTEYGLAVIHPITQQFRQEIAFATEALGGIYAKTVLAVQSADDALLRELGIPEEALLAVRVLVKPEMVTVIGRFDFVQTAEGIKMIEFNADTPTSVVEAFFVNAKACRFFGVENPNEGVNGQIQEAFGSIIETYQKQGYATNSIVFSALGWHDEDRDTVKYLLNHSGLSAQFVALEDLRISEDRLCALAEEQLVPIDVWYRLHALEKLAEDNDERDRYPTGAHVLDLVARGKLAIINPPSAFVAQTKALQSLIWNLHETGEFYTTEEHQWIETYMLPTYMENRFLNKEPYVTKPIFGREGGAVSLFEADGQLVEKDKDDFYWDQPMIYQKRVDMEVVESNTLSGPYQGRLLWGSFLVGGKASAVSARIGERITGNLSCFLPICLKTIKEEDGKCI